MNQNPKEKIIEEFKEKFVKKPPLFAKLEHNQWKAIEKFITAALSDLESATIERIRERVKEIPTSVGIPSECFQPSASEIKEAVLSLLVAEGKQEK